MPYTKEQLTHMFTYHAPRPEQIPLFEALRAKTLEFSLLILESTPPGLEQDSAIAYLDIALLAANSAIAREQS